MNEDCPCDPCYDPRNPTPGSPKRESSGSSIGSNDGVRQVQIVGQHGLDVFGNPNWVGVEVTPDGKFKIDVDELPHGFTGTLVNSNITMVFQNGRLITATFSGSGSWSLG